MRRLCYAIVLVVGLAWGGSVDATIIWSNCPEADTLDDSICMDSYDVTECGGEAGQDVNECSCDHHNLTWTGSECEW